MSNSIELLNKVWIYWCTEIDNMRDHKILFDYMHHYKNKHFEDWLWDHGAMVKQDNSIKYIKFLSKKDETLFILKYG